MRVRISQLSSPASFEVLHAVSRRLEDDFIDEDMTEVETERQTVTNRVVTVRGRHRGRAVVLQYSDFYSEAISPLTRATFERQVLELFVAQPRITFEGTCRSRSPRDRILRLFGGGGLKGDGPVFEVCRIDATGEGNPSCMQHRPFAALLQQMALEPSCLRVKLQAGAGVGPLLRWAGTGSPEAVITSLDQAVSLAESLDT